MPRDTLISLFDVIPTRIGRVAVKTIVMLPALPLIGFGLLLKNSDCQDNSYAMLRWWKR